jgi:hypothetical protein
MTAKTLRAMFAGLLLRAGEEVGQNALPLGVPALRRAGRLYRGAACPRPSGCRFSFHHSWLCGQPASDGSSSPEWTADVAVSS